MRRITTSALVLMLLGAVSAPAPAAPVEPTVSLKSCGSLTTTMSSGDQVRLYRIKAKGLNCERARKRAKQAMKQQLPAGWQYRVRGPYLEGGRLYSDGRAWKGQTAVTFRIESA